MANHIQVLPGHVVNKIAAGEVVERPASVLKELLENAIDAGARDIDVEVAAGGRKLVAVRDDGAGMGRDDALLAIEQHATSKIRDVDDIEHIATLGFRGEALAAIASVSRFRLLTCAADASVGTELRLSGGKLYDVHEIGCPCGTAIEVRDLFFNVPARRKFLRSHQTELSHLRACFIVEALAHPEIGMRLTVDGRELYRLAGGRSEAAQDTLLEDRIRDLFGPDYLDGLRPVQAAGGEVEVTGYVSLPAVSRGDRNEQYLFVNGRATSAPLIGYALKEAYRSLLPGDRHPSVFLFLRMAHDLVDVNVHPTKREVRFRHPGDVRDTLIGAIRRALQGSSPSAGDAPDDRDADPRVSGHAVAAAELTIEDLPPGRTFRYPRMAAFVPDTAADSPPSPGAAAAPPAAPSAASPWTWCRVLGQVGSLYVVMETEDGLVLMDPHAAHERVLFERFMRAVVDGSVRTQNLLLPETVDLMPDDAELVRRSLAVLEKLGFSISEFGGDTFVIDGLPADFEGISMRELLVDISAALEEAGHRGGHERWREESIAQAACKAAVKARDKLTLEEIEQLVVDLARAELPYTCPHGRPTLIFTSYRELNRKFGRE